MNYCERMRACPVLSYAVVSQMSLSNATILLSFKQELFGYFKISKTIEKEISDHLNLPLH